LSFLLPPIAKSPVSYIIPICPIHRIPSQTAPSIMRFLTALVSLLALSAPLVLASEMGVNTVNVNNDGAPAHVPLVGAYHPNQRVKHNHQALLRKQAKAMDVTDSTTTDSTTTDGSVTTDTTSDSTPTQPPVDDVGVIRQNDFNPIGSHDAVIEFSGTADGTTHAPWTVSIDAANQLFHYSCVSGDPEVPAAWTPIFGDIINVQAVADFFDEFNQYDHPRKIPRQLCYWSDVSLRTQVHLRHIGQRSGDIQCTSSDLVQKARDLATSAGCVTN